MTHSDITPLVHPRARLPQSIRPVCGVSITIPVKNEAQNIAPVAREIVTALAGWIEFEVIYVDDGSTDGTAEVLHALCARDRRFRYLKHSESCGQSLAVLSGVLAARHPVVATLDGDGQNPPADLPKVIAPLVAGDAPDNIGLVAGQRAHRSDSRWKKIGSRVGNGVRQFILRDGVGDTGCGLKAFRRDAFLRLPYFDHQHRYMAALMRREGYDIELVDVGHRGRLSGMSKYGNLDRALVGIYDLMGVAWLCRRRRRPAQVVEPAIATDDRIKHVHKHFAPAPRSHAG